MANIEHKPQQFVSKGVQTSKPVNRLDAGKFLRLINVRSYIDGLIQTRPGQQRLTTSMADTPFHSMRRLNVLIPSASQAQALIIGAGTKLYASDSTFSALTIKDSGYSGGYLSMVPHRPTQSPEPWMYVADANRMRKVKVDGTNYPIGIAPPNTAPTAAIGAPIRTTISDFEALGAWTVGGDAGAIAVASRLTGATTITRILYDVGTTGLASVQPSVMDSNIQPGMFLIVDVAGTPETFVVEQVFRTIVSTTIAAITFDTGATGPCTIQLTASSEGLERDALILINSGGGTAEAVRIESVTVGPDGIPSFRCTTVNTHVATETIDGLPSFRAYFTAAHVATNTLTTNKFNSTITFVTGIGYLNLVGALSLVTSSNRPIADSDEIHISLRIDNPSRLLEARVMFDVDATVNDFTHNYLYKSITQNELTQALQNTITTTTATQRIAQQRQLNDYYNQNLALRRKVDQLGIDSGIPLNFPPIFTGGDTGSVDTSVTQTTSGNNQWTELVFKVSDLKRIGADTSRTLKNVAAIRIQFQVSADIVVDVDAWWIGGTYGADIGDVGSPYLYAYTARSKSTGAVSNPSPPMRSGVSPHRQRVVGTAAQHTDSQVDVLDIYRIGGSLNEWHYVQTIANSATPTFTDDYPDDVVTRNPVLEFDNFQPFPSTDVPRAGVCNASGTKVTRVSGDVFNVAWARNSTILINGITYTLYASPTSTNVLETNENVGSLTNATFEIPDAVLLGQPLPVIWGPYGGGLGGVFMFGCGDPRLPGTLFVTKGNNPDAAFYRLEITSGSEVLMNGCIYDGRCYVMSNTRMYSVEPVNGGQDWIAREVANSIGLYARWGICVGDQIYFIGKDGIYSSLGGQPTSITDDTLYNLFMHDAGVTTIHTADLFGITIPDWGTPNSMRLDAQKNTLSWDYKAGGLCYTLIYDVPTKRWTQDIYSDSTVAVHYQNEAPGATNILLGGSNGRLYNLTGDFLTDAGTNFTSRVTTGFEDCGEPRADKLFQEIFLDADFGGVVVTVTDNINNSLGVLDTFSPTAAAGRTTTMLDLNAGAGRLARNIGIDLQWSNGAVRLYEYHYSYYPKVDHSNLRATDWDDLGRFGPKWIQGLSIHANTFGVSKSFSVITDDGQTVGPFTITHNDERITDISFDTPIIANLVRVTTDDPDSWMLLGIDWQWQPEPRLAEEWIAQPTSFGFDGFKTLDSMGYVAHRSTADLTFAIMVDNTIKTYSIPSSGGIFAISRVVLDANLKGRVFQLSITSAQPCRVYQEACRLGVKRWGANEPYQLPKATWQITAYRPFGEIAPSGEARI